MPEETFTEVEQVLFRTTFCKWFVKNSLIYLCTFPCTPYQWSLYISLWCGTVSNGFAKSIEIKSVCTSIYHSCSFGTIPVLREKLKITLRIRTIELCISFKTLAIIPSRLAALWALRLDNKASILLVVISISNMTGWGDGPLSGRGPCCSSVKTDLNCKFRALAVWRLSVTSL